MPRRPTKSRPADDPTRLRLLEAGRELLRRTGADETIDVRLTDACAQAGLTTGAAYPIWPTQQAYQSDLARYVASSFDHAGPPSIEAELAAALAECREPEEAMRQVAPHYLERFVANEDFYLALRFWAIRQPTTELQASLRSSYELMHNAYRNLYAGVLEHYGLTVADGHTLDELTASVTAVTEGFALRHRIDADMVGLDARPVTELYAETLVALLRQLTGQTDSSRTTTRKKAP